VRLGVHLPQFREPVPGEALTEAAQVAEEAGADDLWVSDHLILPVGSERPPASFHDPLTVLTWAAAGTRSAGLGTSVLVVPYRHPVLLAKALASLDALSGGRVIAGLASGWMETEFHALGAPFAERGRRTDAAIAICRELWSGGTSYTWEGRRVDGVALLPGPARAGGPPVWIGGNSDAALRRAARSGDGWHTTVSEPGRLAERVEALERALAAAGRSRADLVLSVRVRAGAERVAELAPALRELGVDHLLVDPPAGSPLDRLGDEVGALRRLV
jgi:probable F420-dependent oxidoreductase